MNRYYYLLLLAILLPGTATAQNLLEYEWEENRSLNILNEKELTEPALNLFNRQSFEYYLDEADGRKMRQFSLTHHIIKVNTNHAIEQHNRIYIPYYKDGSILRLRARSISPGGVITEVDQNSIKELKDDGSGSYRIFAIEGVEKGSEIEYYYLEENTQGFFGRSYFQSDIPTRIAVFSLESPSFLQFEAKSYNGFPAVTEEKNSGISIIWSEQQNIPALHKHQFAKFKANLQRVEFRLFKNMDYRMTPMFDWQQGSNFVFQQVYSLNNKEKRSAQKVIKNLDLDVANPDDHKIMMIENWVKSNILIQHGAASHFVDEVIGNGYGNSVGIARLFVALFKAAQVEHELVLTTNRSNARFDVYFASMTFLETFLFYFPVIDQYIAPIDFRYRFPLIPFDHTFTKGLFIRADKDNPPQDKSLPECVYEIRHIPSLDAKYSFHRMDVKVKLTPSLNEVDLKIRQQFGGHEAAKIQPYYVMVPPEKQDEMAKENIRNSAPDAQIETYSISGATHNQNLIEIPFAIDAAFTSAALLDKAGDKLLLKIGQVIGRQPDLYYEKERLLDVENDYSRQFQYTIHLQIPTGYKVKNLDDLQIEKSFIAEDATTLHSSFHSDYLIEGDLLLISVEGIFKEISCSLSVYDQFREVVNASSDFYNVSLVLEKTKDI